MSVWARIKEHKVAQWTIAYAAAAYTLLHGTEMVSNAFEWPHVVVRIAEPIYEQARTRLEEIARMQGFEGRLVILAEPGMALGDCRIEWADGGLTRERAATEAAIGEAVARYVAARRGGS